MKELFSRFKDELWRPYAARPAVLCSLCLIIVGALVSTRLLDVSFLWVPIVWKSPPSCIKISSSPLLEDIESARNCTSGACLGSNATRSVDDQNRSSVCPDYFRWIHEDLKPWKFTGITLEMVENAKRTANFRLVVVNGTAYVETYSKAFQTRDVFNQWGILQLLRRYPGKIPDLDLMFDCNDRPAIFKKDYHYDGPKPNVTVQSPPALFKYSASEAALDIVFPDWSFWGWPEINIKPWDKLLKELKEGNSRTKWINRKPYAYWKGNPWTGSQRRYLLNCNRTKEQDWNARIYSQDWGKEIKEGFKQSDLASQCIHRYKIYIEGNAWSVSQKYILACNSLTLTVTPHYYDFFSRGLMPLRHYWPIKERDMCRSIKFAVEWGNTYKKEAQLIGETASKFIQEDLKMDYIYDYMFHLLNEYSKLLKFKPKIPEKAIEFTPEKMLSSANGQSKQYMEDSTVKGPSETNPCAMPPPFDPQSLLTLKTLKASSINNVVSCQNN